MNNQIKKFSFSVELNNLCDRYVITVNEQLIPVTNEAINYYELDLDITKRNIIKVTYLEKNKDSFLHIKQLEFNKIPLYNLDIFSTYRVKNTVKKTYGWMDELGTYTINLHSNAVTQNLLTFLLSKKE
jgi:hypothetical protein